MHRRTGRRGHRRAKAAGNSPARTLRTNLHRLAGECRGSGADAWRSKVLVNDITARRVLLLDSTLSHAVVVADTTSATANGYGAYAGTLIRYRGDSALFVDPSSLSMFVLGPAGAVARVMAIPRPNDIQGLVGGLFGTPGVDPRGRLAYYSGTPAGSVQIIRRGSRIPVGPNGPIPYPDDNEHIDSAFVVRVDPGMRVVDTVASFKITKFNRIVKTDAAGVILRIETTPDPLPLIDEWAVTPDGVIAVVRGRDYHVDWIGADGGRSSSARLPFEWQHVSDERKQVLIDSAVTALQTTLDDLLRRAQSSAGGSRGSSGRGGGSSGSGGASPGGAALPTGSVPNVATPPRLGDLPDYAPPFLSGSSHADADGNLWIRTTTLVQGQPVYDVIVNRRGALIDRVQLPPFRTIAGCGSGVVYLGVKDSTGIVHLERALE